MTDPVAGLAEMLRVTRPGWAGRSVCVWDHAGGGKPAHHVLQAVHDIDPDAQDEADLAGLGKVTLPNGPGGRAHRTTNPRR